MKYFNLNLCLAILFNILTNVGFKIASLYESKPTKKWLIFAGALVFGLLNSYYFTEALKDVPLNVASTIFYSLTILGLCMFSFFIFKEDVTAIQITGAIVIIAGVIMISR